MSSRMDKYKDLYGELPTRTEKNKELYKQLNDDELDLENLEIPSNTREINLEELEEMKKDTLTLEDKIEDESNIDEESNLEDKKEVYDIKELISKAITENKKSIESVDNLSNGDYLKKLKLEDGKTNLELVKEQFKEIEEDSLEDEEELMKTANLSLEILSDLKSSNEETILSDPIIEDEVFKEDNEDDFYSGNYKFNKEDFGEDNEFSELNDNGGKIFFKVLLLVFGILLLVFGVVYFISYMGRN